MGKKKLWIAAAAAAAAVVALGAAVYHNGTQQEIPAHTPGAQTEVQEHSQEQSEQEGEGEEIEVVLSEELLFTVIEEELGGTLSLSDLKIAFAEDNSFTLTGSVAKQSLSELLETQSGSISEAYQSVLALLPEELPFSMTVRLAAEQGAVTAELQTLSVSSMELSDDMMGENWLDTFAQGINRELHKQLDTVTGMTSGIDGIIVTGTAAG